MRESEIPITGTCTVQDLARFKKSDPSRNHKLLLYFVLFIFTYSNVLFFSLQSEGTKLENQNQQPKKIGKKGGGQAARQRPRPYYLC